jgi:hypothetical protein
MKLIKDELMTDTSDYTMRVTWEQVDHIVRTELNNIAEMFMRDIQLEKHMGVFSSDPEEDLEMLQKHYDAAKLLLEYYGVGNE